MYSSQQLQRFIHDMSMISSSATSVDPIIVQRMMLARNLEQHEVYVMIDQAGAICKLGSGVKRLTGFAREELIGVSWREFFDIQRDDLGDQQADNTLAAEQQGEFLNQYGERVAVTFNMRGLDESGHDGEYEGLIRLSSHAHGASQVFGKHIPLVSLSLSGAVLSGNRAGYDVLSAWHCEQGESLPEWMQDQVLDTWCAGHPLSFGEHAYIPLLQEEIILLSVAASHRHEKQDKPSYWPEIQQAKPLIVGCLF